MSRLAARARTALLALLLAALALQAGHAQPPAAPLRYRRMYVPADQVQQWPRGDVRYVPIEAEEFERLAARLAEGQATFAPSRLRSAHHELTLSEPDVLRGRTTLHVEHSGTSPTLLPLEPCNVAVSRTWWEAAEPYPATIGVAPDGRFSALVETSGDLQLEWTARARTGDDASLSFALELPRAALGELTIELPEKWGLRSDRGMMTSSEAQPGQRRWHLELGGESQCTLELFNARAATQRQPQLLVRQAITYEFSERGASMSAQLQLDARQPPVDKLILRVDEGLKLTSARIGADVLPIEVQGPVDGGGVQVQIPFATPLSATSRLLRLSGVAHIVPGRRTALPRLRVTNATWQEGTAMLLVPAPLVVEELEPHDGRQTKVAPLPPPAIGESVELQFFSPDGTADVLVREAASGLQVASATQLVFSPEGTRAEENLELNVASGRHLSLVAEVGDQWLIDSVDAPTEWLADWNAQPQPDGSQLLTVHFAKPLSGDMPLRLKVRGRRLATATGVTLAAANLRMLLPRDGSRWSELVAMTTAAPLKLRLEQTDREPSRPAEDLTAEEKTLFAAPPLGTVLKLLPRSRASITLEQQAPRFKAQITAEATLSDGPTWEEFTLACVPESRLDRVLVAFSPARAQPPRWSLPSERDAPIAARRLTAAAQAALGVEAAAEVWEVALPKPRSVPFELRASRAVPAESPSTITLAAMPQATVQNGLLVLRAAIDMPLEVVSDRVHAAPLSLRPRDNLVRGIYRYAPLQELTAADAVAVRVRRPAHAMAQPATVVWRADVQSRFAASGETTHLATYYLESAGSPRFTVKMPAGWTLVRATVDEQPTPIQRRDANLSVALPADSAFPVVRLQCSATQPQFVTAGRLASEYPQPDAPVMAHGWTVWVPPGYELIASGAHWRTIAGNDEHWTRRLFGPLGRGAPDGALEETTTSRADEERADKLLSALGARLATGSAPTSTQTWKELLTEAAGSIGEVNRFACDAAGLAEVGIGPRSSVTLEPGRAQLETAKGQSADSALRARQIDVASKALLQADLALVAQPGRLVLTSAQRAVELRDRLDPFARSSVLSLRPGKSFPAGVATVSDWDRFDVLPWNMGTPAGGRADDYLHWPAYVLEGSSEAPLSAWALRRASLDAAAIGLLLAATALCYWLRLGWSVRLALVALAWSAALAVPAPLASLAAAVAGGALVSGLVPRRTPTRVEVPLLPAAITAVIVLALVCIARPLAAADAVKVPEPPAVNVFIPVDNDRKLSGGRYFVPESFLEQLRAAVAKTAIEPRGWLIRAAQYRLGLSPDSAGPDMPAPQLGVQFDVHVFSLAAPLRIPLERAAATLDADSVLMDGSPVKAVWDDAGTALLVEPLQTGPARLELSMRPNVQTVGDESRIEVKIPRVPVSTLDLVLSGDVPGVSLLNVQGEQRWSADQRHLTADLGGASRLGVRWNMAGASMAVSRVEVDEAVWLTAQPGSVVLEARFPIKVLSGSLRTFAVRIDPRLTPLPPAVGDPIVASLKPPTDDNVVQVQLTRPITDQAVIGLRLLYSGLTGIGRLQVMPPRPLVAEPKKMMLAVTTDPALELKSTIGGATATLGEFTKLWGAVIAQPQSVMAIDAPGAGCALELVPRPALLEARQNLRISVDRSVANVELAAQVTAKTGSVFQYKIDAPADFELDSTSVLEEGAERTAHVSRGPHGEVLIFLTSPAAGTQQITLRGHLPLAKRKEFHLPRISLVGVAEGAGSDQQVAIYRKPDVLITVGQLAGYEALEGTPPLAPPTAGRFVALYKQTHAGADAVLTFAPNQPSATSTQVFTVRREGPAWQGEVDIHLKVDGGLLDSLRFALPENWQEPIETSPPASVEVLGRGKQRELVVRPRTAFAGEARIVVRAQIGAGEDVLGDVTDLVPLEVKQAQRYFVLPNQLGVRQVAWETTGLKRADLPEGFATAAQARDAITVYQATAAHPRAAVRMADRAAIVPQVRLADVMVCVDERGDVNGLAIFDVQPAGIGSYLVDLPPGVTLVGARVGGVAVTPIEVATRRVQLPLASEQLPQQVELLFKGSTSVAGDGATLAAPMLAGLPVERTLWTVVSPSAWRDLALADVDAVSPSELARQRMRSQMDLADLAPDVVPRDRGEDLSAWFSGWTQRLSGVEQAAMVEGAFSGGGLATETAAARAAQKSLAQRMDVAPPATSDRAAPQRIALWSIEIAGERPSTRASLPGSAPAVRLEFRRRPAGSGLGLAAVALAALGLLVSLAVRGERLTRWAERWPQAVVALCGLAWCLWFTPVWVGIILVALSLWLTVLPRRHSTREADSEVVQLSTPTT